MPLTGLSRHMQQNARGGDRQSAPDDRSVKRLLQNAKGRNGIQLSIGAAGGLIITGATTAGLPFSHTRAGSAVTVQAGTIIFHPRGAYNCPKTKITMTNAPHCWIYVTSGMTFTSPTIEQTSTRPISDNAVFRWALLHFQFVEGVYGPPADGTPSVLWRGEINILLPTR